MTKSVPEEMLSMGEQRASNRRDAAAARSELVDVMFRRHYAALVRLAFVMVGDRGAAEDAVDPSVTRLTLVSGADSPTCREGDLFVLDNLRAKDFGRLNLQGDLGRNDCDVAWTGAGWLHLAP